MIKIATITNCILCGKTFIYKGYKKKCCSKECLSKYRQKLTIKQHSLDYDKIIGKIERYIVCVGLNFIREDIIGFKDSLAEPVVFSNTVL